MENCCVCESPARCLVEHPVITDPGTIKAEWYCDECMMLTVYHLCAQVGGKLGVKIWEYKDVPEARKHVA